MGIAFSRGGSCLCVSQAWAIFCLYCFSMGLQFAVCVVSAWGYGFLLVLFQYGVTVSCWYCFYILLFVLFHHGVTDSFWYCFSMGLQYPVGIVSTFCCLCCFTMGLQIPFGIVSVWGYSFLFVVSVWGYSFLFVLFQYGVTVSCLYRFSVGLQFPHGIVSVWGYSFMFVLFQHGVTISSWYCFSMGFQFPVCVVSVWGYSCFSMGLQFHVCVVSVWGYSFLFVTLINLCSLTGILVLPCMKSRLYKIILMFMVALAVGTLVGSGVLVLIPEVTSSFSFFCFCPGFEGSYFGFACTISVFSIISVNEEKPLNFI